MSKFNNTIFSVIVIILFVSLTLNAIQYSFRDKGPEISEVIVRDTVVSYDTIVQKLRYDTIIYKPRPVKYDTIEKVLIYRDTIYHAYGWIEREELVSGELLSKSIDFELNVPEYYKTNTITNTITRNVRNDLLFVQGGFDYSFDGRLHPALGLTYIWKNHRHIVSFNYSFDRSMKLTAGISLQW